MYQDSGFDPLTGAYLKMIKSINPTMCVTVISMGTMGTMGIMSLPLTPLNPLIPLIPISVSKGTMGFMRTALVRAVHPLREKCEIRSSMLLINERCPGVKESTCHVVLYGIAIALQLKVSTFVTCEKILHKSKLLQMNEFLTIGKMG